MTSGQVVDGTGLPGLKSCITQCLRQLGEGCKNSSLLHEEAHRLRRGICSEPESGLYAEMAVHCEHHINLHFDNPEIAGEFEEA